MPRAIRQAIIPLYLLACLMLGGSTRAPWPNMALQLGAIAILGWAALACPRFQAGRPGAQLAVMVVAMIGVIVSQLVPLPPSLWSVLPGRAFVANGFDLLGQPRPWLSLSLAPYDTLTSALWLLPPLGILAGVLRLGAFREIWMTFAIGLAALIGVILGAMQVTGVNEVPSRWYVYAVTDVGVAVGLFANANHMAILLVATLPFLVAMYGARRKDGSTSQVRSSAGKVAILGGATMAMIVGIALIGSLAGIVLGTIALAASIFVRSDLDKPRLRWSLAVVMIGVLVAMAALVTSPLRNNLKTTDVENAHSSRYTPYTNSLRATVDYFPIGSGVGSFADVYPAYENPALVDQWYVNHVHNDYIEVAMEAGIPGVLLIVAFLLWWVQRIVAIWEAPTIDHFARAATIASGAILLHSLVDFPLRTTAISALFAFCVALMVGVRRRTAIELPDDENKQGTRHLSIG